MLNSKEYKGQPILDSDSLESQSQLRQHASSSNISESNLNSPRTQRSQNPSRPESNSQAFNAVQQRFDNLKEMHKAKLESFKLVYEEINKQEFPLIEDQKKSEVQSVNNSSLRINEQHLKRSKHAYIFQREQKQFDKANSQNRKKIEELLGLEQEYKKEIDRLKTQHATELNNYQRAAAQVAYQLSRREQSQQDALSNFQGELERVIAIKNSCMERIKSLEKDISQRSFDLKISESENHRLGDLLHAERHKYLTLEIEANRFKKQLELSQKYKHYDRDQYLQQIKLHETQIQQPLKKKIATLTEELNLKNRRYAMLLQKWNSANGENKGTKEPIYEQTLNTMMGKITELENKSQKQIENYQTQLEQINMKYMMEGTARQQLQHKLQKLFEEHSILQSSYQSLEKAYFQISVEHKKLKEGESEQIESLEDRISTLEKEKAKLGRQVTRLGKLVDQHKESRTQLIREDSKVQVDKMSSFASPISNHKAESRMVENFQDENKELRRKIADLEFQVKRVGKIDEQNQNLLRADYEKQLDQLRKEGQELRATIEKLRSNLKSVDYSRKGSVGVSGNGVIGVNGGNSAKQVSSNEEVLVLKEQHALKMKEMTRLVQSLTVSNQKLLRDIGKSNELLLETSELREFVRGLYHLNGQVDHLWAVKIKEYQNTEELLRVARAL